jgi:hypothetical protein
MTVVGMMMLHREISNYIKYDNLALMIGLGLMLPSSAVGVSLPVYPSLRSSFSKLHIGISSRSSMEKIIDGLIAD